MILSVLLVSIALLGLDPPKTGNQRDLADWPSYLKDYAVGAAFALTIVGVDQSGGCLSWILRAKRPVAWFAGATFTLYLAHLPIVLCLVAISPWHVNSWQSRCLVVIGTVVTVFFVAEITERRKNNWRRLISWFYVAFKDNLVSRQSTMRPRS